MKRNFHNLLLLLFPLTPLASYSQNITGIWRGYFITESYQEYKFELQIQQKGNSISGVSYSYHTTDFYGKATLTGNFNKSAQSALVQEIRTVEVRMAGGSSACIMKCIFQYDKSGKEEFLEGTFTSKFEKNGLSGRKGEDCGGGKVFLRKVTTSDFYVEPFLRNRIKTDSVNIITGSPVIKKPSVTKKTIPLSKAPVKKNPPVVTKKTKPTVSPNTNNSLTRTNTPAKQIIDSVKKIDVPVAKEDPIKPIFTIPEVLKNRENALIKTLVVNDEDVTVKLYDNGIVDGDTISVYLDKKLLLSKKGLSEKPIVMHLKMDEDNTEHELVMVAENLGSIPPNTSVMIVEAGEQRYSVYIESTEKKNAVVRFKYQKSK